MKIATIIGARPQFIKAAPVNRAIAEYNRLAFHSSRITEVIIHTGQHFDADMSDVFFKELNIPKPGYNLGINSANHGAMTGRMLEKIEEILIKEKPDWVLVYGDTNSTLAGALAAVKLHIPIAHVEAGLRSFNRDMPEEHNRVLTDHCSDILFCPTETAVKNLKNEGFTNIVTNSSPLIPNPYSLPLVTNVGDTMYDAVLQFSEIARKQSTILEDLGLTSKQYLLATVHRPYNTDIPENLQSILSAFLEIDEPIIFPVHPRTRQKLTGLTAHQVKNLNCISPVGYLDMLMLEKNARVILTDSGGMQKEAYWFGVPCVTLRDETEWVETVEAGWNVVAGVNNTEIARAVKEGNVPMVQPQIFGDGQAAQRIVETLTK
ncbi:MAG: UDP-N-acetylglucosamine 2-epimerase (non-hydrolyzing) [Deltaproteobacteria bacterium]|nr:UDP-N-acetylglucosamine 2-epimerase (non-hydrolyzing) [Deltaproteobacteria bacterium]MBW2660940.1 UDP-N-acetylglucosamine 2-epimerase (non-hydrolyzing) [Deltaproteobacteria bacterium]